MSKRTDMGNSHNSGDQGNRWNEDVRLCDVKRSFRIGNVDCMAGDGQKFGQGRLDRCQDISGGVSRMTGGQIQWMQFTDQLSI